MQTAKIIDIGTLYSKIYSGIERRDPKPTTKQLTPAERFASRKEYYRQVITDALLEHQHQKGTASKVRAIMSESHPALDEHEAVDWMKSVDTKLNQLLNLMQQRGAQ